MTYKNVFLLLGSNLGDRLIYLDKAAKLLESGVGLILKRSRIYESSPWGKTDQPSFLNQAIQIETKYNPDELLSHCLRIESQLERMRTEKWAERTIDIDIIYFDNQVISQPNLIIPHPRVTERKFVLVPLSEISPEFVHPALKKTNFQLLAECADQLPVQAL